MRDVELDCETVSVGADGSLPRTTVIILIGIFVAMVVDGMDLQMLSLALPSVSKELHLTGVRAGALGTYTLAGMGIGGIIAGWWSDRVGRIRVVWWSVAIFSVCTAAIGFSQTYVQIALMRFASGFGIAGLYSVGTLLGCEYVPTRVRTTVLGVLQAGWSVGYVLAALCATYLLPRFGWRPLFLCAVAPGAVSLVLLWRMPDSPSWLAAQQSGAIGDRGFGRLSVLLDTPSVRRNFLLWTVTAAALQFGYYGANTWLPSYLVKDLGVDLQSMAWYVAATYSMMIVGKVLTGYLADKFGRRIMWLVSGLLTAAYVPMFVFEATPANVPYLLLGFGLLYGAPYAVSVAYMSESFPASVRGTAVGAAYNLGRIGATASPLLIGLAASRYSIGFGIALLGIGYAVCALIPAIFVGEQQYDPSAMDKASASIQFVSEPPESLRRRA
jgi:AAHS family cis,cis-muconate transporter-like MFS transporter